MTIGFPTNTVALIIATMIGSGAASWLILSQGLKQLLITNHAKRLWRWGVAVLLIALLLTRIVLAINPPGDALLATQFLYTFTLLGLILTLGILPLLISPTFRQLIRSVPETWLVGAHTIRVAGFIFLALLDINLLPAEFALSAGYGDMATGLLAFGMIYLLARRKPYARTVVIAWNILGLLDFVGALALGGMYILPFAEQVAASGISLLYLNLVLVVPAFGVPLYAVLHLYSLYQMLTREHETKHRANEAPQTPIVIANSAPSPSN
jgi:hypothetical protein